MTQDEILELKIQKIKSESNKYKIRKWPKNHLCLEDGTPVLFHKPQQLIWDSNKRFLPMAAGTQSGKTSFGPWWLFREIYGMDEISGRGGGDYLAVTASYDLFKLKMLPAMLMVFEDIMKVGRYWTGDKVIELRDPESGEFWATKSRDKMWGRIILRSADALGGLESATAKAAWLDECGQPKFTLLAWRAIRRRLSLNRGRVLMTTTLYDLGWFYTTIIEPVIVDGDTKYDEKAKGDLSYTNCEKRDTFLVQFDSVINPQFPQSEFDEAKRDMPEDEFALFYKGRKANRRFLIYDSFDSIKHTVEPFKIPDEWPRYVGVDFGGAHLCAMFYAENPETKVLYCYKELMLGGSTIHDYVQKIYEDEYTGFQLVVGGSWSEKQYVRDFGWHGLNIVSPQTNEVWLGINRVYAQHKNDGIIYFRNLTGILNEKGTYRRERDSKTKELTNEIKDKKKYHHLDAERYIISTIRLGKDYRPKIVRLAKERKRQYGRDRY